MYGEGHDFIRDEGNQWLPWPSCLSLKAELWRVCETAARVALVSVAAGEDLA